MRSNRSSEVLPGSEFEHAPDVERPERDGSEVGSAGAGSRPVGTGLDPPRAGERAPSRPSASRAAAPGSCSAPGARSPPAGRAAVGCGRHGPWRRAPSRAAGVAAVPGQEGPLAGERESLVDQQPAQARRRERAARGRQPPGTGAGPGGGAAGVVEHPVAVDRRRRAARPAGDAPARSGRVRSGPWSVAVGVHGDSSLSCSRASPAWYRRWAVVREQPWRRAASSNVRPPQIRAMMISRVSASSSSRSRAACAASIRSSVASNHGPAGDGLPIGGPMLATTSPARPAGCRDRAVAHHAIEPGDGAVGRRVLPRQRDERVLHDVLRRVAPRPGEEQERRGVLVEQPTEDLRPDPSHGPPTVLGFAVYFL